MNQYQNNPELHLTIPYRRLWLLNTVSSEKMLFQHFYSASNPAVSVAAIVPDWKMSITRKMTWFGLFVFFFLMRVSSIYAQETFPAKQPSSSGKTEPSIQNGLNVSLVTPLPILVRGRVVDHFGNGVKGALVQVTVKGGKVSAVTDADGHYTIELEGGYKYGSIQIAADKFRTTDKEVNLQDLSAIGTLVPVVTKMELQEDDLINAIRPGMKVNGTVK